MLSRLKTIWNLDENKHIVSCKENCVSSKEKKTDRCSILNLQDVVTFVYCVAYKAVHLQSTKYLKSLYMF